MKAVVRRENLRCMAAPLQSLPCKRSYVLSASSIPLKIQRFPRTKPITEIKGNDNTFPIKTSLNKSTEAYTKDMVSK